MSGKKPWLGIVVGAGLVLNGCAGMSKNQAALVGAATCGAGGAAGGAMAAAQRSGQGSTETKPWEQGSAW